jgi:hypothetical protein
MDKQHLVEKTTEFLRPFETENLIKTMQTLTLQQIFTNPLVLLVITALLFFGVVKRSKTVLLTLFSLIGLIVIMRFAMPAPSEELSLGSIVPFIIIGVVVGGVIIYFTMVKSD